MEKEGQRLERFQNTLEDLKLKILEGNVLYLDSGLISNFPDIFKPKIVCHL